MKRVLIEYDTGNEYGPCSEENWSLYQKALERGLSYFLYPYFGYSLRMIAVELQTEKAPTGSPEEPIRSAARHSGPW